MSGYLFPIQGDGVASPFAWRPYQLACVEAVRSRLETSQGCIAVLPCGTGKTEILIRLLTTLVALSRRAVVVSPLTSLVSQTAARLRLRGVACGVEQGALRSGERITVASYKSLISRNRYQQFIEDCDLVVVDESHMNYSKRSIEILTAFRDSGAKLVGVTATPERMTGDPIVDFYGDVAFNYELRQAIQDGWLVEPRIWLTVAGDLDLSQFDEGEGDFNAERLAKEMTKQANVHTVAQLILQHHEGEPSVVFCAGIGQAERVRQVLFRAGLEAAIVHSRQDEAERDMYMGMFERQELNVILNVGCLGVGWDSPIVRKIFFCKPTRSRIVYQQGVGRGTRPLKGTVDGWATPHQRRESIAQSAKPYFEIFDLVDCSRHNDLITAAEALYPAMQPELAKRIRNRPADQPQTLTELGALLELESQLIEDEQQQAAQQAAAQEALAERKRAAWLAGVEFSTCERDAFLPAEQRPKERGWRVKWGRYKGKLLREVEIGWLQWALQGNRVHGPYRAAIEREVRRRTD